MSPRQDIDIRPIREDETREWTRALHTGFQLPPTVSDADVKDRSTYIVPPEHWAHSTAPDA